MSQKIRIYRRPFPDGKVKECVATFPVSCKIEADFFLTRLQEASTNWLADSSFTKYRYTSETDIPPPQVPFSSTTELQVDVSKAKTTKRPITYNFGWHPMPNDTCECLVYTDRYGSIRGTVENSPKGRRLFINCITKVWPNAKMK